MAGSAFPGAQGIMGNPLIATLSPDQQQNLAQIQQRAAIGQALLAQGLQPEDTSGAQVGGLAYHVSPLNGVSKLLNTYLGNKLSMNAMGQQAQLMSQMYGNAFGTNPQASGASAPAAAAPGAQDVGGSDSGTSAAGVQSAPVPAAGGAQPATAQPTGTQLGAALTGAPMSSGPLTLPGHTPAQSMMLYSMLGPEGYARVAAAWGAPTDATRMAIAGGVDPAAANRDALFHANYVAPNQGTPGTIARDPRTNQPLYYSPQVPEGAQPAFDASGRMIGVAPMAGGAQAIAAAAQARATGEGAALPSAPQYDANGNPLPTMSRSASLAGGAPGGGGSGTVTNNPGNLKDPKTGQFMTFTTPQAGIAAADQNLLAYQTQHGINTISGVVNRWAPAGDGNNNPGAYAAAVSQATGIPADQKIDLTNPATRGKVLNAMFDVETPGWRGAAQGTAAASGGGNYPVQAPGVIAGANAAATSQQSELSKKWTDLTAQNQQAQSVISNLQNIKTLAGKAATGPQSDRLNYVNGLLSLAGSEQATDMVTANNLLDKYSNQITARLGQGGLGTDAARAILQSAYPNSHMTQGAINEAADNLIGAQQMVQAKARMLAPLRNANDAAGYNNKELAFDQSADPRIFQYAGIKDPTARAAFAKNLIQQDPSVVQKIQNLQQLGAFQ